MQIQLKRKRSHKRHFQLLELMVAAFILLICIVPAMRILTSVYQSQQSIIRENQRDHLAHMMHAKITELLYKHQVPLEAGPERTISVNDPDLNELLQKFFYAAEGGLEILESYTPRGQEKPTMYLGKIVVKMTDLAFKPKKNASEEKIQNQNPADTFYDYSIYIDSGEMEKKDKEKKDKKTASQDKPNDSTSPKPPSFPGKKKGEEEEDKD